MTSTAACAAGLYYVAVVKPSVQDIYRGITNFAAAIAPNAQDVSEREFYRGMYVACMYDAVQAYGMEPQDANAICNAAVANVRANDWYRLETPGFEYGDQ